MRKYTSKAVKSPRLEQFNVKVKSAVKLSSPQLNNILLIHGVVLAVYDDRRLHRLDEIFVRIIYK